ncbi:amidase family protein [Oceanobacillus oncorhynchi]|uniref:amidase family protein n=1 Tax=Oceanobacillus oncorhynchi TaxID=545501 RepID=UPI0021161BC7|nr:amidase family protein [Oceanobacillus oncorhynchi]UUI42208.1 amidase family protein [Oceanobacillus oncorhynchi]
MKTTYGLVSTHGIFPTAMTLDTASPMARSVSDLVCMLYYMAGFDANNPGSLDVSVPNYIYDLNNGIQGIKIGTPAYFLQDLAPDIEILFKHAMETLLYLGAEIVDVEIPELALSTFSGYTIAAGEAAALHHQWLQTHSNEYSADIRSFFLAGALTETPQYIRRSRPGDNW